MWPDNDNMPPRDYFMPKLSPWRWVGLALTFLVPIMFLAALGSGPIKGIPYKAGTPSHL